MLLYLKPSSTGKRSLLEECPWVRTNCPWYQTLERIQTDNRMINTFMRYFFESYPMRCNSVTLLKISSFSASLDSIFMCVTFTCYFKFMLKYYLLCQSIANLRINNKSSILWNAWHLLHYFLVAITYFYVELSFCLRISSRGIFWWICYSLCPWGLDLHLFIFD